MLIAQLVDAEAQTGFLARLADPWARLYSDSKAVSAAVLFFHLLPLITSAGAAFAADRATIRAARADAPSRARQLDALASLHGFVVSGLALSLVSGVLLFLSDVETYLGSLWFWVKLALVGSLLLNGYLMTRTERSLSGLHGDERLWSRMRVLAGISAVLWVATTLAGVILGNFA